MEEHKIDRVTKRTGLCMVWMYGVLITVGLLSLFRFDISLTTIAAILTLAGYSVNDTVVNYDRIRENLRKFKKMPQYDLLNKTQIINLNIISYETITCF